jgi:Type II secretion system (T2SS), protein M subtype b
MTISDRDRRALVVLAAGLALTAVFYFLVPGNSTTTSVASPSVSQDSIGLAQQRLVRLRKIAATVPAREVTLKQVSADLKDRELGMIQADTAAQAQAGLLEIARRIGKNEQIDVRGGEFAAPKPFGDYGLVYATVTFECHVEQLVNFLADLSREAELVVPSEERITSANPKEKTMGVRMVLAGLVAKKLVPEKKGLGAF